eukprot:scaffold942_cov260-Pinguiococcus_pyrenoidosus.AAC.11
MELPVQANELSTARSCRDQRGPPRLATDSANHVARTRSAVMSPRALPNPTTCPLASLAEALFFRRLSSTSIEPQPATAKPHADAAKYAKRRATSYSPSRKTAASTDKPRQAALWPRHQKEGDEQAGGMPQDLRLRRAERLVRNADKDKDRQVQPLRSGVPAERRTSEAPRDLGRDLDWTHVPRPQGLQRKEHLSPPELGPVDEGQILILRALLRRAADRTPRDGGNDGEAEEGQHEHRVSWGGRVKVRSIPVDDSDGCVQDSGSWKGRGHRSGVSKRVHEHEGSSRPQAPSPGLLRVPLLCPRKSRGRSKRRPEALRLQGRQRRHDGHGLCGTRDPGRERQGRSVAREALQQQAHPQAQDAEHHDGAPAHRVGRRSSNGQARGGHHHIDAPQQAPEACSVEALLQPKVRQEPRRHLLCQHERQGVARNRQRRGPDPTLAAAGLFRRLRHRLRTRLALLGRQRRPVKQENLCNGRPLLDQRRLFCSLQPLLGLWTAPQLLDEHLESNDGEAADKSGQTPRGLCRVLRRAAVRNGGQHGGKQQSAP